MLSAFNYDLKYQRRSIYTQFENFWVTHLPIISDLSRTQGYLVPSSQYFELVQQCSKWMIIVLLPNRTLGYFPRAIRSLHHSLSNPRPNFRLPVHRPQDQTFHEPHHHLSPWQTIPERKFIRGQTDWVVHQVKGCENVNLLWTEILSSVKLFVSCVENLIQLLNMWQRFLDSSQQWTRCQWIALGLPLPRVHQELWESSGWNCQGVPRSTEEQILRTTGDQWQPKLNWTYVSDSYFLYN